MIVYFSPLVNDLSGVITPGGRFHGETGHGQGTHPKAGPHRALFAPKHSRKRVPPLAGLNDPRRNYEKASYIWSSWTEDQRRPWRQAIKRGGLCARDVWMSAAMWHFARDLYAPDAPSATDGCARRCKRKKPPRTQPPNPGEVWQPPKKLAGHWDQATDCNFGAAWEKAEPPPLPKPPPSDWPCPWCTGDTPSYVRVRVSGCTPNPLGPGCDNNGLYVCYQTHYSPCIYENLPGSHRYRAAFHFIRTDVGFGLGEGFNYHYWRLDHDPPRAWDCYLPYQMPWVNYTGNDDCFCEDSIAEVHPFWPWGE